MWQSTGFAAVAVVLALALRANSARARYWLWLAASVKFLIPFSVLAAMGGGLGRWLIPARPVARVPLTIEEIVQPFAPLQGAGLPAAVSVPAPAAAGVLPVVLLAIWFCGFVAVLLILVGALAPRGGCRAWVDAAGGWAGSGGVAPASVGNAAYFVQFHT